ncbi:patatin-like phospholipase family protein [Patescibacteria group bacterium]
MTSLKKLTLVISGGAARSIAHAGVIRELNYAGINPDEIVATSTGAIVAAAYACGTLDKFREDFYKQPRTKFLKLLALGGWDRGLVDADVHYKELLGYTKGLRFEDVDTKLAFVATDLGTGERVVIDSGDIAEGVQATMAFPGLYPPVVRKGKLLADGGIVDLLPDEVARQRGAKIVVSVESARDHSPGLLNLQKYHRLYQNFWMKRLPFFARKKINTWTYGLARDNFTWPLRYALEALGIRDQQRTIRCCIGSVTSMTIKTLKAKRNQGYTRDTDILIQPNILGVERLDFTSASESEEEGARAARTAIPYIKELLNSKDIKQAENVESTLHRN